ncbi:TetR/AcrR family transcriptional regulator [Fodinicola feengrottensis]|uniref:TetR/AcrR family transcriptional regulator n=3 Tax=Fodinicola feengrottensis TaxID=435914 RepID=A0ABP4SU32_9ACTN
MRTISDAAIEVLGIHGVRGLTHRAVDAAADLPPGSTSYYLRTREALLEAVVVRLVEIDEAGALDQAPNTAVPLPSGRAGVAVAATAIAAMLTDFLTVSRVRMLARYELSLEANRQPALRASLVLGGRGLRRMATALVTRLGSDDPPRHARMLVAFCDGVLFDALAGAGSGQLPTEAELVGDLRELLTAMCPLE